MPAKILPIRYCCILFIILYTSICAAVDAQWQPLHNFRQKIASNPFTILHFTQITANDQATDGAIMLNNNDEFRIIYYTPYPLTFMGYPQKVVVYDYEMEHLTFIKNEENPLEFLTSSPQEITKYFEQKGHVQQQNSDKIILRHIKHDKLIEITIDQLNHMPQQVTFYNEEGSTSLLFHKFQDVTYLPKQIFEIDIINEQPKLMIRSEEQLLQLLQKS